MRSLTTIILLLATLMTLRAQEAQSAIEVGNLRFEGNATLNDDLLRQAIQTRESPAAFWKFLYRISEKLGERAEYYDRTALEADYLRLVKLYSDQGFFHARIDTGLVVDDRIRRVDITFRITEGKRSFVDTLEYRGLEGMPSVVVDEVNKAPLIRTGDPVVVARIEAELRRYVSAFANNGYGGVKVDPIRVQHYASTNNVTVVFSLDPGIRYRFGSILVSQDTARDQINPGIILDHIDFKTGDFYSEAKRMESERNLNRLGVFEATRIEAGMDERENGAIEIPVTISIRSRPFHELTPEIGANDEDKTFNLLFGIGYSNRNFFGGARNLSTRARMNLQSIQDLELRRVLRETGFKDSTLVSRIEISTQIIQPFFFTNKISVNASIGYILEKQKPYLADILRGRLGVAAQLARYTRGTIDWYLERIQPEVLNPRGEDIITRRKDLDPQFNSIITFTLQRDKRDDPFAPSEGFFHSATVEEAGLIPAAFGSLFSSRLPYSRYVKISAVGQWYWDADHDRELVWAARLNGGMAQLYGGSPAPVPLTRRFYGGGGGSVRGWKSRELGAVRFPNEGGSALLEANVEARWHLFKDAGKFWFIDLKNISLVGFYDVGNVWSEIKRVRMSELAMAAGVGFRWDTIAGPIRIDIAFRTYDPREQEGRRWITQRRLFHETYSLIQFGIGHAF